MLILMATETGKDYHKALMLGGKLAFLFLPPNSIHFPVVSSNYAKVLLALKYLYFLMTNSYSTNKSEGVAF